MRFVWLGWVACSSVACSSGSPKLDPKTSCHPQIGCLAEVKTIALKTVGGMAHGCRDAATLDVAARTWTNDCDPLRVTSAVPADKLAILGAEFPKLELGEDLGKRVRVEGDASMATLTIASAKGTFVIEHDSKLFSIFAAVPPARRICHATLGCLGGDAEIAVAQIGVEPPPGCRGVTRIAFATRTVFARCADTPIAIPPKLASALADEFPRATAGAGPLELTLEDKVTPFAAPSIAAALAEIDKATPAPLSLATFCHPKLPCLDQVMALEGVIVGGMKQRDCNTIARVNLLDRTIELGCDEQIEPIARARLEAIGRAFTAATIVDGDLPLPESDAPVRGVQLVMRDGKRFSTTSPELVAALK